MNSNATPKTFEDAFQQAQLTPEDHAALGDDQGPGSPLPAPTQAIPGMPPWALVPETLALPPGREVVFMRFKAAWTDYPSKGDRQCILWTLTDNDEKHAAKRARGDSTRGIVELAKGCVRAMDGHRADWTTPVGPGSVDRFWNDIGTKCRQMVVNYYFKTHALSQEEQADFFTNNFVSLRVEVG